jgi:ABC-type sugar transport system ATPase subunit
MSRVQLEHITKTFGTGDAAVNAVDDISLDVPHHEFMILLGPSGCGKSTLLRMIAGLEYPTSGDVRIGERLVNDVQPKERDVAMVFQSYALYPHKSVAANIEFPLKARGVPKAERAAEARKAAEMLGLDRLLDRKPGQLSGGQRQRVALARAIVRQPAVFCMDEPLSNLDAKMRSETRAELVDLHRRLDSTFIYVTHDQVEAMTMGTRVAVLNDGRLQQVGTPHEVYAAPATVFVAQFLGTPPMNVLPAGALEGSAVRVGFRPEDAVITRQGEVGDEGGGSLPGTVRLVEQLGHEVLVFVEIDGGRAVVRQPVGRFVPDIGEAVVVGVTVGVRHRFDAATGERLA